MTALTDNLLVASHIRCVAGERALLDDLSLRVKAGELHEIRGPNGSGKSTLLRCLVGLHEPASGDVLIDADCLYVGHRSGICGRMTPVENLRWLAGIAARRPAPESVEAALVQVGLGDARHDLCDSLSAGQQRRVALARLVVCSAPLWILDEPLASLDADGCELVGELLDGHRSAGGAAVCATHQALPTAGSLPAARVVTLGA